MPRRLRVTGTLQQNEQSAVGSLFFKVAGEESREENYSWSSMVCREIMTEGLVPDLQNSEKGTT